jgi:hypothetical protein
MKPTSDGSRLGIGRGATLAVAVAAMLAGAPATPQRGRDNGAAETRDCINVRNIDRTRVADAATLLFYMRDGEVYRNDLSSRCPSLAFDERFMYRVTQNRICELDVITVIDDVGFGFMPGASCGLGKFRRISDDEAQLLAAERPGRRRDLPAD